MALLFVRSHIKIHEQNIIYDHLCIIQTADRMKMEQSRGNKYDVRSG